MKKIKKLVIPAAGFGTRFLPYSKSSPKEMINIVDKPSIQYIVEEAVNSGIEDILIITSRNKESIENHFDKSPELEMNLREKNKTKELSLIEDLPKMAKIYFVRQTEMLGLGHAILQAKNFIGNEPFGVILGDDIVDSEIPCLKQLIDIYNKYGKSVLGVQRVEKSEVNKYGIAECDFISENLFKVNSLVEKPPVEEAKSDIAILGRYILTPEIFDNLSSIQKGKGGEYQLTDAIKSLMNSQEVYACNFVGKRYDAGDKLGYMKASVELALKHKDIGEEFKKYLSSLNI